MLLGLIAERRRNSGPETGLISFYIYWILQCYPSYSDDKLLLDVKEKLEEAGEKAMRGIGVCEVCKGAKRWLDVGVGWVEYSREWEPWLMG